MGEQRAGLLNAALMSGRVYVEDGGAICAVVDNEPVKEEMCPTYHTAAEMPSPGAHEWQLKIRGRKQGRRTRTDGGDNIREEPSPEVVEHSLSLPVLRQLAHNWREQLQKAADGIGVRLEKIGLASAQLRDGVFKASLDGEAAAQMARDRLLTDRAGLSISVRREIEYEVPLELAPMDASAERMFALDRGVREILSARDGLEAMRALCGEDQAQRNAVIDRMWQMRLYRPIYDLRESEDFST